MGRVGLELGHLVGLKQYGYACINPLLLYMPVHGWEAWCDGNYLTPYWCCSKLLDYYPMIIIENYEWALWWWWSCHGKIYSYCITFTLPPVHPSLHGHGPNIASVHSLPGLDRSLFSKRWLRKDWSLYIYTCLSMHLSFDWERGEDWEGDILRNKRI